MRRVHNRSAHGALDAIAYVVIVRKVNWLLDADIRSFLAIDHEWLQRFPEHRIGASVWSDC